MRLWGEMHAYCSSHSGARQEDNYATNSTWTKKTILPTQTRVRNHLMIHNRAKERLARSEPGADYLDMNSPDTRRMQWGS